MNSIPVARLRRWLPTRGPGAHKGEFGHVLLVAGSRGMSGAAALAARAAFRSGAGLVTVAVPQSIQSVVAGMLPEALTLGLAETKNGTVSPEAAAQLQAAHQPRKYSVLALGPGLGVDSEVSRAVVSILGTLPIPAVVDADGLNNLAQQPVDSVQNLLSRRNAPALFTPHPGEAGRLLRVETSRIQADRLGAARRLAREFGVGCVLKGQGTCVVGADGKNATINSTGNPGLAKGGTGDVLTGVIAALWAQQLVAREESSAGGFEAAALGAYLHGLAADLAVRETTIYSLLASDVIEALPRAFKKLAGPWK